MQLLMPDPTLHRQSGAGLLLILLVLLPLAVAFGLLAPARHSHNNAHRGMLIHTRLQDARQALLAWAGPRLTQTAATRTPPGFLPYPDRNGDGNYDGTADCLSGTGVANHAWRTGRLPFKGERLPCESRDHARAEVFATAAMPAQRALASLNIREHEDEMLWYAASVNVLDDDRIGNYPDISVSSLMQRDSGWLTVCAQNGQLLAADVAFVVLAPGPALPGQRRRGAAPGRQQFLDAFPLEGSAPCNNATESNADNNTIFIANSGATQGPPFNDQLTFVRRNEYVSRLALAQARYLAGLLQQQPFPYAAGVGSSDGRCVAGQIDGHLPLLGGPSCAAMHLIPPWLEGSRNPQYVQLRYMRSPAGDQVTLVFDHCAMRFTISHGGFSYAPAQC